jgi:hypothetical protein
MSTKLKRMYYLTATGHQRFSGWRTLDNKFYILLQVDGSYRNYSIGLVADSTCLDDLPTLKAARAWLDNYISTGGKP